MLAYVGLQYGWSQRFQKTPPEDWPAIRKQLIEVFPQLESELMRPDLEEPDADGNYRRWNLYLPDTIIDLAQDGLILALLGIEFTVKRFKGAYMASTRPTTADVIAGPQTVVNLQVAIPDLALLHIGHVMVMEDCCTEELQRKLDAGWRILAICPPHAQRRPDYIIGHTDPHGR